MAVNLSFFLQSQLFCLQVLVLFHVLSFKFMTNCCFSFFLAFSPLLVLAQDSATLLILQKTQAHLTAEKNIGSVYFASIDAKALLELFFL